MTTLDNGSNIGQPQVWYEDKDGDTQGNQLMKVHYEVAISRNPMF